MSNLRTIIKIMEIVKAELPRQEWMDDTIYEWYIQEEVARRFTAERAALGSNHILIAVKAQHPLDAEGNLGAEYEKRMQEALNVEQEYDLFRGDQVTFMTFGGIHAGNDRITLAEAGKKFLERWKDSEKSNILTRPQVFSGNDEDRLAVEEFLSDPSYKELHIVCSVGQVLRAYLSCAALGVIPHIHTVSLVNERPHQSLVCELWGAWGVPSFARGLDVVEAETEKIRQRHLAEQHSNPSAK